MLPASRGGRILIWFGLPQPIVAPKGHPQTIPLIFVAHGSDCYAPYALEGRT